MSLDTFLSRTIRSGEFLITDVAGGTHRYGVADPARPPVHARVRDGKVRRDIMRRPVLGTAEAYMDGRFTIDGDDILGLLDLVRANTAYEDGGEAGLLIGEHPLIARMLRANSLRRARRNVAHHYDIGNALYDLFLDADRQYSCAYFARGNTDLDRAQADKKAHIAAKLALRPGLRVLDIGCGWGGMALYLARVANVEVLGITLSEEQLAVARARAEEAGLADRVRFELIDYRHVDGTFDRIVSVGMFEHVGTPHYRTFFAKCRDLLVREGVMLLHTIGRMGPPGLTDGFTARYIFPGGYAPALSEIMGPSERERLMLADCEVLRLHYALTLEHWYARVGAAKAEIVAMYDERFYRMWRFYLAGSITAFRHSDMAVYQLQYVRDRHALPITRDYMAEAEAGLIAGVSAASSA
ncbi:class I SAM-dependent methyltransferase [Sphingomonas sp.]|uniref:class I SAM-dependent methyltransferase n=1 Tax=Sphingomonas sp. TaxID=28214 RepID=UPI003AFFA752